LSDHVELTAEDSGYFRVFVDGVQVSQHTTEREAAERVIQEETANPAAECYYDHPYKVRAEMIGPGVGSGSGGSLGGGGSLPVESQAPSPPVLSTDSISDDSFNVSVGAFVDADEGDVRTAITWQLTVAADPTFASKSVNFRATSGFTDGGGSFVFGDGGDGGSALDPETDYLWRALDEDSQANVSAAPTAEEVTTAAAPGGVLPDFEDDFEGWSVGSGLTNVTTANGFAWHDYGGTKPVVVNVMDDFGIAAYQGSQALQFTYNGSGSGDAWSETRFRLAYGGNPTVQECWMEYYLYIPAGTESKGAAFVHREDPPGWDNNKFISIYNDQPGDGSEVSTLVEFYRSDSYGTDLSTARPITAIDAESPTEQRGISAHATSLIASTDLGNWVQYRHHFKVSGDGTNDGEHHLWKNGTLWTSSTSVNNESDITATTYYERGYLMGWANSGYAATTYFLMDAFKYYKTDPGW